jgi:hypothetical protein
MSRNRSVGKRVRIKGNPRSLSDWMSRSGVCSTLSPPTGSNYTPSGTFPCSEDCRGNIGYRHRQTGAGPGIDLRNIPLVRGRADEFGRRYGARPFHNAPDRRTSRRENMGNERVRAREHVHASASREGTLCCVGAVNETVAAQDGLPGGSRVTQKNASQGDTCKASLFSAPPASSLDVHRTSWRQVLRYDISR